MELKSMSSPQCLPSTTQHGEELGPASAPAPPPLLLWAYIYWGDRQIWFKLHVLFSSLLRLAVWSFGFTSWTCVGQLLQFYLIKFTANWIYGLILLLCPNSSLGLSWQRGHAVLFKILLFSLYFLLKKSVLARSEGQRSEEPIAKFMKDNYNYELVWINIADQLDSTLLQILIVLLLS